MNIKAVLLIETDRKEFDEKLKEKAGLRATFTGSPRRIIFYRALIPLAQTDGQRFGKKARSPEIAFKVKQQKQDFIFYAGPKELRPA